MHNILFNKPFTLYANETYNYSPKTGSYPQIIYEQSYNATGGVIACTKFLDISGKQHEGWIPTIKAVLRGVPETKLHKDKRLLRRGLPH